MSNHRSGGRAWHSLIALLVTVVTAAPTASQQAPLLVTLDEAIEIALDQNPSVQQAENSARLGTLAVRQQQRALLPDLRLTTSTSAPYASGFETDPAVNAGISTSVQVSNIYSTMASIEQARIDESGGGQNLLRAQQTVIFNVISNYLSVLEAQEQVVVQRQNVLAIESQEAQIQAFVDAGRRPISDLYQQQASTAGARLNLVQAERGLVVARMNLIRTLQLDPFAEYEFVAPEASRAELPAASLQVAQLTARAFSQRPDLAAAALQVNSAEQGVKIADATRWPTLSLSLGYGADFTSANSVNVFDQLEQRRGGSLQLGLSVPLLDSTTGITRERARIQVDNARIGLENTRQAVATEVQTAFLDLELAERQLEVAELQLRSAELALEVAQQRYDVGAGTLLELTQAQSSQVRAASDLVNARYGLLLQNRVLEYHLGELDGGD
ncbi:MAG: TolC family protein [Gemmatimonadota bacterium]